MATTAFKSIANNIGATLASSITSGQTSIVVSAGQGALFPVAPFFCSIDNEVLICSARASDTLTVVRGQDGTSAVAHDAGDLVELRPVAQLWEEVYAAVNALESGANPSGIASLVAAGVITNSMVNAAAGIALSKLQPAPRARAYHSADQSITSSTFTTLALNSERYDNDAIHDAAVNNSRLTCKTAGAYNIFGNVGFEPNATGYRELRIMLNGATLIAYTNKISVGGAQFTILNVGAIYELVVNDYVELSVWQNSGVALNVRSLAQYSPELSMVRVG